MGFLSSTEEVKEELASRYRVREVVLKWLFGEIKFSRDEFLAMFLVHDHVVEVLNKCFCEEGVMHIDVRKEEPQGCIRGLTRISTFLDKKIAELRGKLSPGSNGILRVLEQFRSASVEHAKEIARLDPEMEGNRGEQAEFKVRFPDWSIDPLRRFRLGIYPHLRVLIDLLPDDHPAKTRASEKWYEGRVLLLEEQKDQATPHWRLRESDPTGAEKGIP